MASWPLFSQPDTILQLQEVEITAQRIDLTDIGKHSDKIDSQILTLQHHDDLASILSRNTPLFVRSYGNGTLATLGIRGGGAAHTQILWNGIPLRNPMLGLIDLALIPAAFVDAAAVHYGGHGAAFGSGAIGGLISVSTDKVNVSESVQVTLGVGSWGNRFAQIRLDYGLKNIRFSSRLFAHGAENNYRYRLNKDIPERNQTHHRLKNQGLLQEINVQLNKEQSLTARLWYQSADRQIPPISTQTTSKAAQQDRSLRTTLQWYFQGEKIQWQLKSAWLDEIINYQDTLILLYTHNQFRTWLAEGETSMRLSRNIHLTGGIYTEVAKGESINYTDAILRHQTAVFSSFRLITRHWNWRFQIREEITERLWSPLLLDLSTEWSLLQPLIVKASISRNYRTPTLNDLNWRPGGNPQLSPEEGWTYEAGLHYGLDKGKFQIKSSVTTYTRMIDDWIMWMPPVKDSRNYWSPINIASVESKGIESRGKFGWSGIKWDFDLRLGLDLTWSTFAIPLEEFGIQAGDQLFYVPVENAMTGLTFKHDRWSFYYDHHWFGSSTAINDSIRASNVGSVGTTLHYTERKVTGSVYLQIDNVWNVPYRIIERRPMPGRSFTMGVKFSFS